MAVKPYVHKNRVGDIAKKSHQMTNLTSHRRGRRQASSHGQSTNQHLESVSVVNQELEGDNRKRTQLGKGNGQFSRNDNGLNRVESSTRCLPTGSDRSEPASVGCERRAGCGNRQLRNNSNTWWPQGVTDAKGASNNNQQSDQQPCSAPSTDNIDVTNTWTSMSVILSVTLSVVGLLLVVVLLVVELVVLLVVVLLVVELVVLLVVVLLVVELLVPLVVVLLVVELLLVVVLLVVELVVLLVVVLLVGGWRLVATVQRNKRKHSYRGNGLCGEVSKRATVSTGLGVGVGVGVVGKSSIDLNSECNQHEDETSAHDDQITTCEHNSVDSFKRRLLQGVSAAVEAASKPQKKRKKGEDQQKRSNCSPGDDCFDAATISSSVVSSARHSINNSSTGSTVNSGGSGLIQTHRLACGYTALSGTVYHSMAQSGTVSLFTALSGTVYPSMVGDSDSANDQHATVNGQESRFALRTSPVIQSYQLQQSLDNYQHEQEQQQHQPSGVAVTSTVVGATSSGPYGVTCSYVRPTTVSYVTLHRSQTVESEGAVSTYDQDMSAEQREEVGTTITPALIPASETPTEKSVLNIGVTPCTQTRTIRSLFGVVQDVLSIFTPSADDCIEAQRISSHSKRISTANIKEKEMFNEDILASLTNKPEIMPDRKMREKPDGSGVGGTDTVRAILGSMSIVSGPVFGVRGVRPCLTGSGMGIVTSYDAMVSLSSQASAAVEDRSTVRDVVPIEQSVNNDISETIGYQTLSSARSSVSTTSASAAVLQSTDVELEPQIRRQSAGSMVADGTVAAGPFVSSRRQSIQPVTGSASSTRDRLSELVDAIGLTGLMRTVKGNYGTGSGTSLSATTGAGNSSSGAMVTTPGREEQFWVPPTLMAQKKRAHSLQSTQQVFIGVCNQSKISGSDIRNGSAESIKDLQTTATDNSTSSSPLLATLQLDAQRLIETQQSFVQASLGGARSTTVAGPQRRRRASMQDALDYTKINTSLYETNTSTQFGGGSGPRTQHPHHQVHNYDFASIQEENIGSINFSVAYDPDQSLLIVRLIQARDLVPRDFSGTADPFCRLRLVPSCSSSADRRRSCGSGQLQSRVHRRTVCPEFEESFVFDVAQSDLTRRTLEVLVFDYDQFSQDECVGQVLYPLDQVAMVICSTSRDSSSVEMKEATSGSMMEPIVIWKGISAYEKKSDGEGYGELMFSLSYLSSAERLTVAVIKARRLRPTDDGKTSVNPYVRVSVNLLTSPPYGSGSATSTAAVITRSAVQRRKRKKTTTKRQTLNPVWNEALVFSVDRSTLADVRVELAVFDDGRQPLGNDEPLGGVAVGQGTTGHKLASP